MPRFNLADYVEVKDRVNDFYEKYPNGFITTEFLNPQSVGVEKQTQFIVKATVGTNSDWVVNTVATILATGLAEETFGKGANETSPLENCETSAIGRALANLNFSTTKSGQRQRPSREEMTKVNNGSASPEPNPREVLKNALGRTMLRPKERKDYVDSRVGRTTNGIQDLSDAEVENLLAGLDAEVENLLVGLDTSE